MTKKGEEFKFDIIIFATGFEIVGDQSGSDKYLNKRFVASCRTISILLGPMESH